MTLNLTAILISLSMFIPSVHGQWKRKPDWEIRPKIEEVKTPDGSREIWATAPAEFPVTVQFRGQKNRHYLEAGQKSLLMNVSASDNRTFDLTEGFYFVPGKLNVPGDGHVYQLPFEAGKNYVVTQGANGPISHTGGAQFAVDLAMAEGTPIHAARGGVVVDVETRYSNGGPLESFRGKDNYIAILHDDSTIAIYRHLKEGGVIAKPGQKVQTGEFIGYSGRTGFGHVPHLHFELSTYSTIEGRTQSIPVKFHTANGPAELKAKSMYNR